MTNGLFESLFSVLDETTCRTSAFYTLINIPRKHSLNIFVTAKVSRNISWKYLRKFYIVF